MSYKAPFEFGSLGMLDIIWRQQTFYSALHTTMSNLRVLVVGASIAGPATAYWLAKTGAKVTIIERFPRLRTNGQNIDIRTTGVSVMRKIPGMEEAVRANLQPMDGISLVRKDGRAYGTMIPTGDPDRQSLISEYEILRGDLSWILYDLTKNHESVNYIFGEQVASLQQSETGDGPVQVEFMNGTPSSEYDLVVACDGATSRTRAIGLGCAMRDYMQPINAWSAYFSVKKDLLNGSQIGHAYSAVNGRAVAIGPDPSGGNRATLMGINPRKDHSPMAKFREANKLGTDALKDFVAQQFQGAGWKCDEVVQGMMEADDFYASEWAQVKTPTLHKGRFVMVGDAGYAPGPTGTGTSLALTGAYLLAGEVGKHRGDLVAGLKGYEEQIRPLIDRMQKIPPLVPGMFAPQTAWGIWVRNMIFAFLCWSRLPWLFDKFFGAASAHSDGYKLPEYQWTN
jgi:2-polyprenyl-6-methoxyphenol hydroxylase-like FAD-dependent oxidoreductase